jgi:outer membrane protein assembly factor BamB
MDAWSHARHAADGNPVSGDEAVGPPRRVRWVTGPQTEISNMVTAGGRSFFAGVLARDAFNGLRLWERAIDPSPARGGFNFPLRLGSVSPIATDHCLLVANRSKLQALDASSGRLLREYSEAGSPQDICLQDNTIVVVDAQTIRALDLATGALRWKAAVPRSRCVAVGDGMMYFVYGGVGNVPTRLACRRMADGALRWEQTQLDWLGKVRGCVYHRGVLACEISTLADTKEGNALHVLAAGDGSPLWMREYIPGASHKKQARAMFVGDLLWVLEAKQCVGLDLRTGLVRKTHPAPSTHCFPPVASTRYLFSGEMDLTDLETGVVDANPITKTACSRDAGVVPANGLLYTFPKHCICWPMLRDYAALAPARPGGMPALGDLKFTPQAGPAAAPRIPAEDPASQWPCYRHDALRSGSTTGPIPHALKVLWTAAWSGRPEGVIADDWRNNYFIRGPVGPPVAAGGMVFVTRPDVHQVVALHAATGRTAWTFTANGRVDTAPTIHRGLCLFGSKSGWVYCLRADNGGLVWRLRAAPLDERIVAYGQLESPWPVPGSVLVAEDAAYFAAGRQSLADGGIFVFAIDPATGAVRWVQRLGGVPQKDFYGSSGLEFDNFDLLQCEGTAVAMSRWLFDRTTGRMSCRATSGFARLANGHASVLFPRGSWSYAPRNESEQWRERPYVRPLAVFRDGALYGCSQDRQTVFRRDFHLEAGEKFDTEWFAGWDTYSKANKGGDLWRTQRIARGAAWSATPFSSLAEKRTVSGLILAGDVLCVAAAQGRLAVLNVKDGGLIREIPTPPPAWDGLAAAEGRLFLSTEAGGLICMGHE